MRNTELVVCLLLTCLVSFSGGVSSYKIIESSDSNNKKEPQHARVDCRIKLPDAFEVDLATLAREDKDYVVKSVEYPGYDYIFNVCRGIVATSTGCTTSDAVCERKRFSNQSIAQYGTVDSIKLHIVENDVVMNLTGQVCPPEPSQKLKTIIYFQCEDGVTEPIVNLRREAYYECAVEFTDKTGLVCTHKGPFYRCSESGTCEAIQGGGQSKEECESSCKESLYVCSDDQCVVSTNGQGFKKELCEKACKPSNILYKCQDSKCVETTDGKGTTKELCENICNNNEPLYKCESGNKCVETTDGTGVTKEECESTCKQEDDKYKCINDKCVASEGGVPRDTCMSICEKKFGV